jgi:hypothetical protein
MMGIDGSLARCASVSARATSRALVKRSTSALPASVSSFFATHAASSASRSRSAASSVASLALSSVED